MLTYDDFVRMEEIDHEYFPTENVTSAEEAYKWYLADPNSCIYIKENNKVIAYINILSLNKSIYDKVKYNEINESKIVVNDLNVNNSTYFNYLYFSCIAIDKNHRNLKTLKNLLETAKEHINQIIKKGYEIVEVMADCSTPEGEKISQRFLRLKPFNKTSHNSVIHILDGKSFILNVAKKI